MSLDWDILDWIQNVMQCDLMDFVMPKITFLGDAGLVWIVIGICLLISKKYRKLGIFVLVGLFIGLILGNGIVKNIVARPRPCWILDLWRPLVKMPQGYSFPSGHTQASFIAATILFLNNKKMGIPALILASTIAFSRLYLVVHFPTDVLAGLIMGVSIALFTNYFGHKIYAGYLKQKSV